MDYKVLYRKYRPLSFDELVGQEYLKKILVNSIVNGRISHAYIFAGPRGTGKTSTAKIFARAINCLNSKKGNPCGKCQMCLSFENSADIIEIDAASNNGVEEVRQLIENVKIANTELKYKVYIIDEVHMMTNNAFNALLLTLEEPPPNVVFILATTDIQSVPITILSRCQTLSFKPISEKAISDRLEAICKSENIEIEPEAISEIAMLSTGGLRDALGYLDQLSLLSQKITACDVVENYGGVSVEQAGELINALEKNDIEQIIEILEKIKSDGADYSVLIKKLLEILKERAIAVKYRRLMPKGLSFDDYLKLSADLIDCSNKNSLNTDIFSLIELCFLTYCHNGNDEQVIDEQKQEILAELEPEPEEKPKPKVEKLAILKENKDTIDPKKVYEDDFNANKKIRINNCFMKAAKNYKKEAVKNWETFIAALKSKDKKMYGIIVDTEVVAASDLYYIVTGKIESAGRLVNGSLKKLEQTFYNVVNSKVKIIVLTPDEWEEAKNNYKDNLKNNIKYEYIEEREEDLTHNDEEGTTINDIFDVSKVEII